MGTPDCLLHNSAIRDAIHSIYSLEYASVLDEYYSMTQDDSFSQGGGDLFTDTRRLPDAVSMPIAWYLLGRTAQAWGCSVGLVFHHAGITTASEQSHALSVLFLSLVGHGVTLDDDYSGHIAHAEMVLTRVFKAVPFSTELDCLRELAEQEFKDDTGIDMGELRDKYDT